MELLIRWPPRRNKGYKCGLALSAGIALTAATACFTTYIWDKHGNTIKRECHEKYEQLIYLSALKVSCRTKVLFIKWLPFMYYFGLPHLMHKTLVAAHTRYDNGSHWKYATYSKFISFTTLYSAVFYTTPFLLKLAVSPSRMNNFQQKLFQTSIVKPLQKIQDKKIASINHIFITKYNCPDAITNIIWLYAFNRNISVDSDEEGDAMFAWFVDNNKYKVSQFIKDERKKMQCFNDESQAMYNQNPVLYLHCIPPKIKHSTVAAVIDIPGNFLLQIILDFAPLLSRLFRYRQVRYSDEHVMRGITSLFLGRYPVFILLVLMIGREFVMGPVLYARLFFNEKFHQQATISNSGEMDPQYLKLISIICQNWSSILQSGWETSPDMLQIEWNQNVINKIDLERRLNNASYHY